MCLCSLSVAAKCAHSSNIVVYMYVYIFGCACVHVLLFAELLFSLAYQRATKAVCRVYLLSILYYKYDWSGRMYSNTLYAVWFSFAHTLKQIGWPAMTNGLAIASKTETTCWSNRIAMYSLLYILCLSSATKPETPYQLEFGFLAKQTKSLWYIWSGLLLTCGQMSGDSLAFFVRHDYGSCCGMRSSENR